MGMFTELYLACKLKNDIPDDVMEVLNYMFNKGIEPKKLPNHKLFMCGRWECIGRSSSFYFNFTEPLSKIIKKDDFRDGYDYYLITLSNFKNYDNEIEHFLDWISPYLDCSVGDHIGHYRYETDRIPTFIFKE